MSGAFEGLEPNVLWEAFAGITRVPRPSGKEARIIAHLRAWADAHHFAVEQDEAQNLLVKVPATPGKEGAAPVCLQGHMDMVCEKNQDVAFDFENAGIQVVRDRDWLKAAGTTLGADNGIGVAMAMAVATDPTSAHGPLELLFTVDEETALTGATNMRPGFVSARRLINVDSEEEGVIFIGCAGGGDTETVLKLRMKALRKGMEVLAIRVKGLKGGHSGLTIHENRANALKLLGLVLLEVERRQVRFKLCRMAGGDKHNAIPREAEAVIAVRKGFSAAVREAVEAMPAKFRQEFGRIDPDLRVEVEAATAERGTSQGVQLARLLLGLPHGVEAMSRDIPGLVETSSNLAKVVWGDGEVRVLNSSRSAVAFALERMRTGIESIAMLAGAEVVQKPGYPGWQPDPNAGLLAVVKRAYAKAAGKEPHVTAIHAGLECGIIGEKHPGMEMLSIGPTMHDVHSPNERLSISSASRFYGYLKAMLADL
jgi:dipeptidase D